MNNWWATYLLTLLTEQFLCGVASVYSVLKHDIQKELNLSQTFFGFIELICMLSRMLGSIYLILYPPKRPKFIYLICTTILTTSCLLFLLSFKIPSQAHLIITIAMFGVGLARAGEPLPYILAYKNLNSQEDVVALNIWQGLNVCGYAYAYLLDFLFRMTLNLHWTFYVMIYAGIYFLTGFLTYIFVDEVELSEVEGRDKSACDEITEIKMFTVEFFDRRKVSNWLLLFDFSLMENLSIFILLWLPYYLTHISFTNNYTLVVLAFPIFCVLGVFILNPLISLVPHHTAKITSALVVLSFLSLSVLIFLGSDPNQLGLYFFVIGAGFFCWSAPFTKAATNEIAERVESVRENFLMVNIFGVLRELFSAIAMLITGIIVEKNIRNFLWIFLANSLLIVFVHVGRRIRESVERNNLQLEEEENYVDENGRVMEPMK